MSVISPKNKYKKCTHFVNAIQTEIIFQAKEITVESESVFQSEVLIFVQKAEVKADGRAYASGNFKFHQ